MRCDIYIIIHSTEDYKRVINKFISFFSIDSYKIKRHDLSGHHGNPLIYVEIALRGRQAKSFIYRLFELMDGQDLYSLKLSLDEYFEKTTMYLRIDKQYLCMGRVRLAIIDPIKIVIRGVKRSDITMIIDERLKER